METNLQSQFPDENAEKSACVLPKRRFDELLNLLKRDGYEVLGPKIEQAAIIYGTVASAQDLPIGWTDKQAPGSYRLERRNDEAYFGFAVGPHSWKSLLFPSTLRLWSAQRTETGFEVVDAPIDPPRRALLGVRACELQAMAVQDRVFIDRAGGVSDPYYEEARKRLFIIGVECEHPAGTCFCASMGTGPHIAKNSSTGAAVAPAKVPVGEAGRIPLSLAGSNESRRDALQITYDLVLTELDDSFVVRSGSAAGMQILNRLQLNLASSSEVQLAQERVDAAAAAMGRTLDSNGLQRLLHENQEHPRWDEVAVRCLSCTNCTLVCPTCFCSSVEEVSDLTGDHVDRTRRWDSCFNPEFAQVHGGNFRPSTRGRYRQWLTHKFASWFDQFDVSGCVGCGRCITWCPVGIDVTEEISAIRATNGAKKAGAEA
ncbi:4Fe-4S dicluster domain-containing protein [soil metagenome]